MPLAWALAAVPFLILLNAFFVAGEYAVVAAKAQHLAGLRSRGWRRTADVMEAFKASPASAIGTIQVCITMTNLLLGWIGEPAMSAVLAMAFGPLIDWQPALFGGISLALSFIVVTLLTVVFSELLPKALTLQYVTPAAILTAVPIGLVQTLVRPLVWVMNVMANAVTRPLGLGRVDEMEDEAVTPEELRLLAMRAGESGAVSPREQSLILASLTMGRRQAREIMVPRIRVSHLDLRKSMDANREVINQRLFSRLPLCDGSMDNVIGLVHVKEFLSAYHAEGDVKVLSLIARKPVFMPESVSLERLLETFHEQKTQFVFLVDEYGGVEGIVTLKDVVDELIGPLTPPPP
jgi:CBS domain containing-hemolysin-like protein